MYRSIISYVSLHYFVGIALAGLLTGLMVTDEDHHHKICDETGEAPLPHQTHRTLPQTAAIPAMKHRPTATHTQPQDAPRERISLKETTPRESPVGTKILGSMYLRVTV